MTLTLFELYQSRKESTKYVIGWLWSTSSLGASTGSSGAFKSTVEMVNAAKRIRQQKQEVPSSVITFLCEAIKNEDRSGLGYLQNPRGIGK
jgi:hypothetical protein